MTAINLPSLSFNIDESSDKETLNNILDTLQLYRKELNFLLMNLDEDNMPSVIGRIEDGEGNISNISQTVDEISMTVSSNAGDISNLQIKADQISAKVANAQGDIAALVITANGISSTVASHTGQISQINQTASGIQTQVSNQAGQISSLQQTASGIQTQVSNHAGQISTLTQTAQGIQTQVTDNKNRISTVTQTMDGIRSQVSSLDREVGGFYSEIVQLDREISSRVSYSDYNGEEIVSLIEQTPNRIKLSADKIELDGITEVAETLYVGGKSEDGRIVLASRFTDGGIRSNGESLYIECMTGVYVSSFRQGYRSAIITEDILEMEMEYIGAIMAWRSSRRCYIDATSTGIAVRDSDGNSLGNIAYN